eukprot:scaffold173319_cov31-Tisochrysis_lutea.AAC.1
MCHCAPLSSRPRTRKRAGVAQSDCYTVPPPPSTLPTSPVLLHPSTVERPTASREVCGVAHADRLGRAG